MTNEQYTGVDYRPYLPSFYDEPVEQYAQEYSYQPIVVQKPIFLTDFFRDSLFWFIKTLFSPITLLFSTIIFLQRLFLGLKSNSSQVLQWGKGSALGLLFQSILVCVGFITGVSFLFGQSVSIQSAALASGNRISVNAGYAGNNYSDVIVEEGSLETILPEGLIRSDMETYVVHTNDTVDSIAKTFEISTDTLRWANNIKKGGTVQVGQELKIPQADGVLYTVKAGDTLESIASKFKSSTQAIFETNHLDKPVVLAEGKELMVPAGILSEAPEKVSTSGLRPSGKARVLYLEGTKFLGWPVQGGVGYVTQCPNYWNNHVAMDISAVGSPMLVAAARGVVTYAGYHPSGYAWVVEIDHGNGFTTLYGHMVSKSIVVHVGDIVEQGQVIGRMGQTGRADGIHVHFELANSGNLSRSKRTLVPPTGFMIDRSKIGICIP